MGTRLVTLSALCLLAALPARQVLALPPAGGESKAAGEARVPSGAEAPIGAKAPSGIEGTVGAEGWVGAFGRPVVVDVELHLPPGTDPAGLAPLVAVRRGDPVSRREVRRSLERLHATGRFATVSAWAHPRGPGRAAVIFQATPRTLIDRVEFEGNALLSGEVLLRATRLTARRPEYYPELARRMEARVQEAYERIGYAAARASATLQAGERGEVVLSFAIQEGPPLRVGGVHAAGDPRLPAADVVKTLGLGPGDVLDLERLEKGVQALRVKLRAEGHHRARIGAPEVARAEGEAHILLPLSAGPRIEFRFVGNRAFGDAHLLRALEHDAEEPLDAPDLARMEGRLVELYRLAGFADVRVRARQVQSLDPGLAFALFTVEEGEPLRVVEVRFEGGVHFDEPFLRARLEESLREASPEADEPEHPAGEEVLSGRGERRSPAGRAVASTEVLHERVFRLGLDRIVELYRADGFLGAAVELARVERDELTREARVLFRVREGARTRISEIAFVGAPDPRRAQAVVGLRPGQPLNSMDVETSRVAIQRLLGKAGYLYARVRDEETFSPDRTEARVLFRIHLGPKVRVGRILVQGLVRTHVEVVRAALALKEAAVLDPEALSQSQRNLVGLGIFRNATIRLDAPEVPDEVKDLFVTVEERLTLSYGAGAGYSLVDGPRAFAEGSKINLLGRALQLRGQAKVNWSELNYFNLGSPEPTEGATGARALGRRVNLGLQYPRFLGLLPTVVGARVDLVHERVNRPAYSFERTGAILGADMVGQRGLTASMQYELESDYVEPNRGAPFGALTKTDIERLRFEEGTIHLHSVRPSVGLDLRDDPVHPRRGLLLSSSVELVQSLGGRVVVGGQPGTPFSLFVKATGQAAGWVPLWRGAVLALSLTGGKVFPLDPRSKTIVPKRFFMGGAGSMRGFLDDAMIPEDQRLLLREQVQQCDAVLNKTGCSANAELVREGKQPLTQGGELFTLARGELRLPLARQVEGAVFLDTGNLWLDQSRYAPLELRFAAGVGLRVATPIGAAALDLGFNLVPDPLLNESRLVPHFSVGLF